MEILILGGTAFLSAATARQAIERGHRVTCLARGSSGRPPEGAVWVPGDRDDGPEAYAAVAVRDWDAVIDVAREPVHVRQAVQALGPRAAHWTLVSTISVYAADDIPGQDETAPVHPPLSVDRMADVADYGPAKVACEEAVLDRPGDRAHLSRAGLITGPGDPSDRFGYWPARFARERADDVVVPGTPDARAQLIDVDDLAGWLLDAAEQRVAGILNATGPSVPLSQVLDLAQQVAGHRGRQVAIDPDFLQNHGVRPWAGPDSLPLWLPAGLDGFATRSTTKAEQAGLHFRPLEDLVARALDYERQLGLDRERAAGLSPATEARLLAAWRAR